MSRGKRKARTVVRAHLLVVVVMNDGFLSAAVLILFLDDRRSVTFPMLRLPDDRCAVPIDGSVLVRLSDCDASADRTGLNADTDFIRDCGCRDCTHDRRSKQYLCILFSFT